MSSTVREWWEETKEDWRERPEVVETKSDMSGNELRGGTKTVEREPLLDTLLLLSMDKIVLIDPVGERVTEAESGTATGRLTVSLFALVIKY